MCSRLSIYLIVYGCCELGLYGLQSLTVCMFVTLGLVVSPNTSLRHKKIGNRKSILPTGLGSSPAQSPNLLGQSTINLPLKIL